MKSTVALALVALLTPSVALAQVAQTPTQRETTVVIPERENTYSTTTELNTPMIMGGAILFGGSYGASVIYAANSDREASERLYVPLVGPWLALNDWEDCPGEITDEECDSTTTAKVLLIGDGVAQAVGVLAVVGGLLSPRRTVVDTTVAKGVHVAPTHNGAVVFGSF